MLSPLPLSHIIERYGNLFIKLSAFLFHIINIDSGSRGRLEELPFFAVFLP
jgi:hypothetical protein